MILLPTLLGIALATGVLLAVAALRAPALPTGHQLHQHARRHHRVLLDAVIARCTGFSSIWLAIPTTDLAVLDRSARGFLHRRILYGAAGGIGGLVLGMVAGTVDVGPALPITGFAAVGLAASASLLPVLQVRDAAATRRDDYRRALAAFLELVAQERTAGRAPTQALLEASELGEHRLFARIAATVRHAQRLGHTPWHALRDLGDHIGVRELGDVADLAETAATGAAVYTSMTSQAASLRHTVLTTDKAAANAATERLTLPACLLMIGFLGLVLYPTTIHLLT